MQEERLQVLKMVDEGKITVDEATKLLDALKLAGGPQANLDEKFNAFAKDTKEFFKEMGTVLLVIHLLIAIFLVGLILIQRASGGALDGLGGGNSASSFMGAQSISHCSRILIASSASLPFGSAKVMGSVDNVF